MQHGSDMHSMKIIRLFETNFTNDGKNQPKEVSKTLMVSDKKLLYTSSAL